MQDAKDSDGVLAGGVVIDDNVRGDEGAAAMGPELWTGAADTGEIRDQLELPVEVESIFERDSRPGLTRQIVQDGVDVGRGSIKKNTPRH
jgi:hypothetical protein